VLFELDTGTRHDERYPLLRERDEAEDQELSIQRSRTLTGMLIVKQFLKLTKNDPENHRSCPRWRKLAIAAVIAFMTCMLEISASSNAVNH
jgi:hypothetical protein